ncbi:MAG: WecB/TagA/CpsF family glycosyltransferase [Candidatus Levybacteria bacterium]|nr:WecB/TagA/CpsF family glycosyltransferase [Candidatus Levybacteria bacterium]
MIVKNDILGVGIVNATKKEILEYIIKSLEFFKKKYYIVTPNPEFLVLSSKNLEFKNILNKANLALADGIGVIIAAKFLGKPLKGRLTGVELLESLCKEVSEKPITVGFLGGGDGVAEKTAECLRLKHPNLKIVFVGKEWPNVNLSFRQPRVSDDVQSIARGPAASFPPATARSQFSFRKNSLRGVGSPSSGITPRSKFMIPPIDILFVAFGAPKQEIWISENLDKIPVKIAVGVGGAFDYISGKMGRAPTWVQNIGFEWLYRLIRQPWRIKRQFSLLEFIFLVLKEKLS